MKAIKTIVCMAALFAMLCAPVFAQVVTDFTGADASGLVQHGDFAVRNGVLESYTGTQSHVVIPANLGITSISSNAFGQSLISVVIPEGVTTFSFAECYNLQSVTIPNTVTRIEDYAYQLTSITSIVIPSSVTSIGDYAFSRITSLTSIVIPNSVTSIGWSAFERCTSLTSITIPNSVTSIGLGTFSGCTSLTSITIPNSVNNIESFAFSGCTNLQQFVVDQNNNTYTSVDGVLFNKARTELVQFPLGREGSYVIPNSVTTIRGPAFQGCTRLTSITIPSSVTSIENYSFSRCTSLTSITIPSSVTSIGEGAFLDCISLTSIAIPSGVTNIRGRTFQNCNNLTSITIGANIQIDVWAFVGIGNQFTNFYNAYGRIAGTYTYNNGNWSVQ